MYFNDVFNNYQRYYKQAMDLYSINLWFIANASQDYPEVANLFLQRTNCLESILQRSNEENLTENLFSEMVFFICKVAKSQLITIADAKTAMNIVKPALSTMNN